MNKINLTLDESAAENTEVKEDKTVEPVVFTEEENRQMDEFSKKIDLTDSGQILQYGAAAQNKIAGFSEKTLNQVRTGDLDEVGALLTGVVTQLKGFNPDSQEKGLKGLFHKGSNRLEVMKTRYATVEANVENVKKSLEGHQIQLLKDIATFDQLYELNKEYYKEISMYIEAGKRRLKDAYEKELPALEKKAVETGLPTDAQAVNDFKNMINRFEKKLHDLELTQMVSLQMAPQIRMVQSSDAVMAEKIQSTITNTIPLWKSQMVISLGAEHSMQAAKAQEEVTDFTNALLKKNADALKAATVETARTSERGVVDIETLEYTNNKLIEALAEVRDIQQEGTKKRAEASQQLVALETQLKEELVGKR